MDFYIKTESLITVPAEFLDLGYIVVATMFEAAKGD
jgi:hypothetical protein